MVYRQRQRISNAQGPRWVEYGCNDRPCIDDSIRIDNGRIGKTSIGIAHLQNGHRRACCNRNDIIIGISHICNVWHICDSIINPNIKWCLPRSKVYHHGSVGVFTNNSRVCQNKCGSCGFCNAYRSIPSATVIQICNRNAVGDPCNASF